MNILRKLTQLIPVRVTATPHGLMNCPLPRPLFPICLITAVFFVSMFECDSEFKRWPREDENIDINMFIHLLTSLYQQVPFGKNKTSFKLKIVYKGL